MKEVLIVSRMTMKKKKKRVLSLRLRNCEEKYITQVRIYNPSPPKKEKK